MIMKKIYSQPQTQQVKYDTAMLMQAIIKGSNAQSGAWGVQERGPKFI